MKLRMEEREINGGWLREKGGEENGEKVLRGFEFFFNFFGR